MKTTQKIKKGDTFSYNGVKFTVMAFTKRLVTGKSLRDRSLKTALISNVELVEEESCA